MKFLSAILLLLLGITEAVGQDTSCAFDYLRQLEPHSRASENFFYDGLRKWRLTGQIPREYPNPEIPYHCDHCLTINPSLTQVKFVIPVVLHVVHLPSDSTVGMGSNISPEQIQDQLTQLNNYFANLNGGSKSVNTGIQFCLAPVGPDSSGIIRYSSSLSNHYIEDYQIFQSINTSLPQDKYLHIFTCNNILTTDPGYRGYSSLFTDRYQGVTVEYNRFGKYNALNSNINVQAGSRGKVLVHEVGHFLGLYHTF